MAVLSKGEYPPWLVTNENRKYIVVLCHILSLSVFWSIDFHLCFGWRDAWWMGVGVLEFWPFLCNRVCPLDIQFSGKNACVTWQTGAFGNLICPLFCYCPSLFSAPLSVLLSLSAIAVLPPYCSGAGWSLFLLVTIVVTPYGLVSTLTVTCHAITTRWR
jgi:hypothetical protein